ncbi:MAG TPA: hypothetical protein VFV83_05170, partial [Chthoniobacteraceae bacterium]|nr:hypothetical protein [Chthoniobacteraceae bacterium]
MGAITPATLFLGVRASATDRPVPPNFTINSDVGTPVYTEGLLEGYVDDLVTPFGDDELTPNPANSSPELTLRMGQLNQDPPGNNPNDPGNLVPDQWANGRTWIYTGQINTGPNGILSFAANNDDTDWLQINGTVVLNDNGWDVSAATVVTGLTPNTWVDFEFRVSDTGTGGAGPSGQNADPTVPARPVDQLGWTGTIGVVMSYTDELLSNNVADYELGLPTEPAGGGATLFRYQSGFGFDDDFRITADGTITIDGGNPNVTEPSMRFENAAPATLTISDGTGVHKVLSIATTTSFTANNQAVTIAGTSDLRPGALSDGAFTGNTLTHVGPGALMLDTVAGNDLNGTTIRVGTGGRILIRGSNNANPVGTLSTPLTISGAGGIFDIGTPLGAGMVYNNALTANENGSLVHSATGANTFGSAAKPITVAAGKTLTVNNTGGLLTLAGPIVGNPVSPNSGTVVKTGASPVRATEDITLDRFVNSAGTTDLRGTSISLTNLDVAAG